jgi:ankyrin repeat protein
MENADIEHYVLEALRTGASPNARDGYGETLLIQAIENNRESVVRLLLKRRANVNLSDTQLGDTPLIRASYTTATENQPLTSLIRLLIQNRADPNRRNKVGDTALHLAVGIGHSDIVAALLKAGADFRARDRLGRTALQLASVPVSRGSISMSGVPTFTKPNDPKQVEKEIREYDRMMERMARAEEQRLTTANAKARRLLKAAGAKE